MDLPHSDIHNEHLRHLNFHIICLKACCLEIVLSSGDFEEENGHLQDLLLNIETVFQDVEQELSTVGVNITKITFEECYCVTVDTDGVISSILERLELLNPDIQQLCELISSKFSPRSVTGYPSHETVKANVKLLLRHIEYLVIHEFEEVAPLYKDLESTRKSLVFLRNFLGFTSKRTSKHIGNFTDLVNHAEFVVRNIACLLYLCPVYFNVNDPMGNDWIMQFSSELFNFSPEQAATREIYINALEGSKSSSLRDSNAAVDEFDYEFLESLKNSILELSETKFGFIACNRDHILSLHKEIRILTICFAMSDSSVSNRSWFGPKSPLELDHILHISNYFREHISAIIIDMGCLIYTLYNDEQNMDGSSNQLKMAVTALQDSIKTAQENARKEYQPYIPKSWLMKTKLRIADAKGIVLSLTRAWEKSNSYASEMRFMSYYLHRIRDDVFSAFQEELQSLIEAFSKLTEQNIKAADFRIIHADDIRSKAEYFFSSNWVDFWSKNLMLFLLIEDIKKINRKIEDLQCQIMQESKESDASVNVGVGGGIEDHEDNLDLICTQKVEIGAHGLKEAFLEVFLRCKGKKHTEHEKLRVLITSICSGSDGTGQDIQRLFADSNSQISPKKGCFLPINMDGLFCKSSRFISCFGEQAIMDDDEEALLKNLNALLQNIEILLKYNNELVDPMKEEHEAAQKILRFLRNFIGFTSKSSGELQKLKDLLIHSEVLVGKISFLLYLCCDIKKMNNHQIVNEIKMNLSSELQKFSPALPDVRDIYIKSLKASKSTRHNSDSTELNEYVFGFLDSLRDYILELLYNNPSYAASKYKYQVLSLLEELKFLINIFTVDKSLEDHYENEQISHSVFECIKAVMIDMGCVVYSINNEMNNKKMAMNMSKKVPFLVANFLAAKAGIREIYDSYVPRPLWSDFPSTNGHGFINSLLWNLNELSSTKDDCLVAPLKHIIEIVEGELLALREYFIDSGTDGLQSQWSSFLDTAYQTEYVIDSFLAGDCHLNCNKLGLFNVIENIKRIKKEIKDIEIKKTDETSVHKSSCFPTQVLVKESDLPKRNAVISSKQTETDEKSTSKLLIFEEEEKNIREKLTYGSEKLSIISIVGMGGIGKTTLADSVFEHSAVTQHFYVKARCTVSQVHDRRRLLLEILKQLNKQCSDNDDELDRKLYQSLKGRRYLIFMDDVWDLRPWEDLRASFPNESNGSRIIFTTRSHDIAAQTLTIDLVAGVLREKDSEEWKSVAESLMTILFKDPERRCQEVVELSYRNLPDDIKPCFLYYAAFPEDENVSTEALISLWIAEGFVLQEKDGESRRLEDVGNDILKKLISRSLVTVSRETPMGEVAATRVHDLLHEFAVSKAREENFMLRTDDQRRDPYRLCIYPENWVSFLKANPSGPRTRSLICCDAPSVINNILLNLSAFKLLRVLYIPNANSCHYHPEMFRLIHLRVFVIGGPSNTNISLIMAKIHKFRNLECFIMSTVHQSVNLLLDKICKMERLRTFCFGGYISFQYRSEKIWETSSLLRNLRTLYNLKASYEEDIEKILNLMPNLVVLEVVFYSPHEDSHQFPKLDFLNKLEFLKIMHKGESGFSARKIDEICFPQYLKTLVLSNFRLPWTEIWKLGNLEFLETLKLEDDAFEGPIWDMIDGQFPNLKYLNLFGLDIQEWNASGDHLCRLQGLLVSDCRKLEELPPCLAEIETLQRIKMVYCKDTAEISALEVELKTLKLFILIRLPSSNWRLW